MLFCCPSRNCHYNVAYEPFQLVERILIYCSCIVFCITLLGSPYVHALILTFTHITIIILCKVLYQYKSNNVSKNTKVPKVFQIRSHIICVEQIDDVIINIYYLVDGWLY